MRSRPIVALVAALALLLACSPSGAAPSAGPVAGGCPVLPADNIWNARVDGLPVAARSAQYVASIGATAGLKADFGSGLYQGAPIGIPFVTVPASQANVAIHFVPFGDNPDQYGDESDPGPYPVPSGAPIEGGPNSQGDRHVLVIQQGSCTLYELYKSVSQPDGSWNAVASARYDLRGNALRPDGWTSADAAGLPIFPGLVRYEEVSVGAINHALRFTAPQTQQAYVWPARHLASDDPNPSLPPMGQRFRLKASVDITRFSPANRVILQALKTYGLILADNGSPWFVSGAPNDAWDNDALNGELRQLKGSDFEAVDVSSLRRDPNSGQVLTPVTNPVARALLPLVRR